VQVPQRALEILNLAFVIDFLPLGQFECFEHFLHFIERVFEFLDHSVHLVDGVGNGRRFVRRSGRLLRRLILALLGLFHGGLRGFGGGGGWWRVFTLGRGQGLARFAATGMAAATASGAATGSWGRIGWCGRAFLCFVRRHKHRLPRGNQIAKEF
jgi:hypothetical protein